MESYATDLLTALAVVMNGVPQGLLSLSLGFAAFPTAIAFLIGAAGSFAFNSVATISFQAETIAVAGKLGSTPRERMSLVFWGALFLLIPSSLNAMMAGVGVMLALVSIDMLEAEKYSGISSMAVALATWFITFDLAKTVIISVIAATIVFNIMKKYGKVEAQDLCVDESRERLTLGNIEWKIWKYPKILVSGLALACLNIGAGQYR